MPTTKRALVLMLLSGAFLLPDCSRFCSRHKTEPVELVDPLIGADNSVRPTVWEANGGTFPGAAVPFGMVQLTPEGYKYSDKRIKGFSFLDHTSGYPNGSSGIFQIMPFCGGFAENNPDQSSCFSHQNETAQPGYYAVLLDDSGIKAELTVTEHAGYCRFVFPHSDHAGLVFTDMGQVETCTERLLSGKRGHYYYVAEFSQAATKRQSSKDRVILDCTTSAGQCIDVKVGFSRTSVARARHNLATEIPAWDFERVQSDARKQWNQILHNIRIQGGDLYQQKIFYTALYHALLDPHLQSDAGCDSLFYSDLSPWDTYHSKQPLLALLTPTRLRDMIGSLLRNYKQTGCLPVEDMEGIHNIAIIVDSYFKGITDIDITTLYQAMRKSLLEPPYARPDLAEFIAHKYTPGEIDYSLSKTLDYAYDYWALAQLAKALHKQQDYTLLLERAHYYHRVFNPSTQFMTARNANGQWTRGGYREGTAWTYTWCVQHDVQGLINLFGGPDVFTDRLDSCFSGGYYVHDNEPPLHYAYLFNYAAKPWQSQYWVRELLKTNYSTEPGGLPGNDDLGALSAWYVFSAMGFYPTCPGSPVYQLVSPVFREITLLPEKGTTFTIKADNASNENIYIRSVLLNGKPLNRTWITHQEIIQGGTLEFDLVAEPDQQWAVSTLDPSPSMTAGCPQFHFAEPGISVTQVRANDPITVFCRLLNSGQAMGAARFALFLDGKEFIGKWVIVDSGAQKTDSLTFRLYSPGSHQISVGSLPAMTVQVLPAAADIRCLKLMLPSPPVLKIGEKIILYALVKNFGSYPDSTTLPLLVDDHPVLKQTISLGPGEEKQIPYAYAPERSGMQRIGMRDIETQFLRVFPDSSGLASGADEQNLQPLVILTFDEGPAAAVPDHSGQGNNGQVVGQVRWVTSLIGKGIKVNALQKSYIELAPSKALAEIASSEELSVMAWIFPLDEKNFSDIITQGDWNTLQLRASNSELNYYSGSWSRGEVYSLLPENWNRHWHHVAGVTDGDLQKLYVDGRLQSVKKMHNDRKSSAPWTIGSYNALWNIGRNADIPNRVFNGYIDEVRIYKHALSQDEIVRVMMLMIAPEIPGR